MIVMITSEQSTKVDKMIKDNCKEKIYRPSMWRSVPCSRKAVKDGFCKQHHPDSIKEREEKSKKEYDKKMKSAKALAIDAAKKLLKCNGYAIKKEEGQ